MSGGPKRTPREAAAEVVGRVLDDGAFLAPALDAALQRWGSGWEARDRALATELSYGTVRWAQPLEDAIRRGADKPGRKLDKRARPHLLVAAYQLQHLADRIPAHAAVDEAVKSIRKVRPGVAGFANAILRRLGSPLSEQLPEDADKGELARAFGVPEPLLSATLDGVPADRTRAAIAALNARPSLGVRWLGADEDEEAWVAALPGEARAHPFVPHAWLLDGAGAPAKLPGFPEGQLVVMDPGSQVCALLVAAPAGARVLDLCAAPGGKSALLARAVTETGRVVALDRDSKRAPLIGETAARVGGADVAVVVGDAGAPPPEVLEQGPYDAVLLDAPCSGLGTVRRRPEIRLRRTPANIAELAALQAGLLRAAAELVRPGGTLVYSVCTPVRAEGLDVVEAFLAADPRFAAADAAEVAPWLPADARTDAGFVRLHAHRHDADAFFAARLSRRAEDR